MIVLSFAVLHLYSYCASGNRPGFFEGFFCTKCLKKIILLIFILPSCDLILIALALMLLVTNYVCNKVAVFCFEF